MLFNTAISSSLFIINDFYTCIYCICIVGHSLVHIIVRVVERITAQCQRTVTISEDKGNLPLHFACKNGHTEVIKRIVEVVSSECIKKAEENDAKKKAGTMTEEEWHDANLKTSEMRQSLAAMYVSSIIY